MALREFIQASLEQNYNSTVRSMEGLGRRELDWSPNAQSMSIGFLVWHYARTLDRWLHGRTLEVTQLWEQGWADRFDRLPPDPNDTGYGFTDQQVRDFKSPSVSVLLDYALASKTKTIEFLDNLDDDDLVHITVLNPRGGRIALATMFQQLIWESNQHGGQIAYIRGLQRGIEDATYSGGMLEKEATNAQ